jgi:cytochrome c-type biogenesis protein CcmF
MVPVLIAMAIGPMLSWKRGDLRAALQRLWVAGLVALLLTLGLLYATFGGPVLAVLGLGLAAWTAMGVLSEWAERVRLFRAPLAESWRRAIHLPRAAIGMTIAHFGLAVTVAGISASAFDLESMAIVPMGGSLPLAGYMLRLDGVGQVKGANFTADDAQVTVTKDGQTIAVMHPQRRYFPLQDQTTAETAIRTNPLADLYIALGDPHEGGGWTLRAYWKPMVSWIWLGGLIMAMGGVVSLSDRRWRVGAAVRLRLRPAVVAAGE